MKVSQVTDRFFSDMIAGGLPVWAAVLIDELESWRMRLCYGLVVRDARRVLEELTSAVVDAGG
jgi:hypothetical protein